MDKSFDECLKDRDILNIMGKVEIGYRKAIDKDDLESIKMDTLWKCLKKYDESKGAKFTSYLFQQLDYAFRNKLKVNKKNMEYSWSGPDKSDHKTAQKEEVRDMLYGLSDEIKNILNQRFFQNMTMVEIADANGYSRETARRRLKIAIKKCKKINMIEN